MLQSVAERVKGLSDISQAPFPTVLGLKTLPPQLAVDRGGEWLSSWLSGPVGML